MSRYHGAAGRLSTRYDGLKSTDFTCNGCGTRTTSPSVPAGWFADGEEHYCPGCGGPTGLDNAFLLAYVEAALWSSTDDNEEPLDNNYGSEDMDPDTMRRMRADCAKFQRENAADIAAGAAEGAGGSGEYGPEARAGHDFWLTRCGHGAGFWDGDWPEPAATRLTEAAHAFGEVDLYVGDQGKISDGR
jgi:hypothetical protein